MASTIRATVDRIVDRRAALDELVAAQPHPEGAVGADGRAHGIDDLEQQAGPVGQRAAVVVVAEVGGRGEEAADDGRVRALQLDAVEPAADALFGHQGVAVDDLARSRGASTAFGTSRNSGSGTGLGAHTGSREYMLDAWPPLWLIWAKTGTSWACTASVIRR